MRQWPGGRLSLVHLNVLMTLEAEGPLPMGALAEAMDVSQASVTGIVDRMEQRDLVERQRGDEDRRGVRGAPTRGGHPPVGTPPAPRRGHKGPPLGDPPPHQPARVPPRPPPRREA